jgi:hypothetical protein
MTAEITVVGFNLDYSKFQEGINPFEILQMLTGRAARYLHERQRQKSLRSRYL